MTDTSRPFAKTKFLKIKGRPRFKTRAYPGGEGSRSREASGSEARESRAARRRSQMNNSPLTLAMESGARRVIWFKGPERALADPTRFCGLCSDVRPAWRCRGSAPLRW